MAHDISFQIDGNQATAEAIYRGVAAWHGLGIVKENITLTDCYGLVPSVTKQPLIARCNVSTFDGLGTTDDVPILSHMAMVRDDNNRAIGVVGAEYMPYQYLQLIQDFVEPMVTEGSAEVDDIILLAGGARCNILLKLNADAIELDSNNKKDILEPYILVRSGHDGLTRLSLRATAIRVVCKNTESLAIRSSEALVSGKHSKQLKQRIELLKATLTDTYSAFAAYGKAMRALHELPTTSDDVKEFAYAMFGYDPQGEDNRAKARAFNNVSEYRQVYLKGTQLGTVKAGTWGGAYNAFTDMLDHADSSGRLTGDARRRDENRFVSILDGTIATKRNAAQDYVAAKTGLSLVAV